MSQYIAKLIHQNVAMSVFLSLFIAHGEIATAESLTEQRAIEKANVEASKWGLNLREAEIFVDVDHVEWDRTASYRKTSPIPEVRDRFKRIESALDERHYWPIRYRQQSKPGSTMKDGVGWVFIDIPNGEVLAFIRPGD